MSISYKYKQSSFKWINKRFEPSVAAKVKKYLDKYNVEYVDVTGASAFVNNEDTICFKVRLENTLAGLNFIHDVWVPEAELLDFLPLDEQNFIVQIWFQ